MGNFYPHDEYHEGLVTIVLYVWQMIQHKILIITIEVMILLYVWQMIQYKILLTIEVILLLYVWQMSQHKILVTIEVKYGSITLKYENNIEIMRIILKLWE